MLAGGALRNSYRGQRGPDGRPVPRGLVGVGDAVATTTPTFGQGLALTAMHGPHPPLPPAVVLAAAARDPRISEAVSGYFTMIELPDCLKAVEPLARAVYQTGWRPPYSPGPTRDELVEIASAAVPA